MLIRLSKLSESRVEKAMCLADRIMKLDDRDDMQRLNTLGRRSQRAAEYARQARKCLTLLHYQREADTLNRMRCGGAR